MAESVKRLVEGQEFPCIEKINSGYKLRLSKTSSAPGIYLSELAARKKYQQCINTAEAYKSKRQKQKATQIKNETKKTAQIDKE